MKRYKSVCPCGSLNYHADRSTGDVACTTCWTHYEPETQEEVDMIGVCKGCGDQLTDITKEYCCDNCKPDYKEKRAKKMKEFEVIAGIEQLEQITITVGRRDASDSIKLMDAIEQVFDKADLTHNEQKSVAEWVWMEYGRGQDQ